jgi:competence ComEA-like helix-hairpin-helix protein
MSGSERGMVLALLALAVLGHAIRWASERGAAPGEAFLMPGLERSAATHRAVSADAGRPLGPGERINPDSAPPAELARLPGIGMRLAKEIAADRELRGPFGSPEALARVRGIGPVTVARLEPHLRFAGTGAAPPGRLNVNTATGTQLERLPGIGPSRARAILAYREKHGPFAEVAELARVPGIGPAMARRLADLVVVR